MKRFFRNLIHDYASIKFVWADRVYTLSLNRGTFLFFTILFSCMFVYGGYSNAILPFIYERNARMEQSMFERKVKYATIKRELVKIEENNYKLSKNTNKMLELMGQETTHDFDTDDTIKNIQAIRIVWDKNDLLKLLYTIPHGNPTSGNYVSGYGFRTDPFTRKWKLHTGADISNKPNTRIYATHNGIVTKVGVNGGSYYGYGYIVVIKNPLYQTLYAHMNKAVVRPGMYVHRGQLIGFMGSTGMSTGPHLHYEVRVRNELIRLDPSAFLYCRLLYYCKSSF